ncbi:MAG: PqqD family protein [Polyangiaceae bacterium]
MTEPASSVVDRRLAPAADVHTRMFDGEMVLVDLKSGDYYGLNELGARLWDGILAGKTPREIATSLEGSYAVEAPRLLADLVALADDLVARRLLVVSA